MRPNVSVWHVGVLGQCSPYITVRVRRYLVQLCYECGLKPSDLRAILCKALKKQPDQNKDSLWMASASSNSQPSLSMSANVDSIIPQKAHILTVTRWSNATFLDVMPAIPRASCIPRTFTVQMCGFYDHPDTDSTAVRTLSGRQQCRNIHYHRPLLSKRRGRRGAFTHA